MSIATALTVLILFGFLVYDVSVGRQLTRGLGKDALQVRVTGHQWWWELQYRDSLAQNWVTTANEIHIPVGRPVVLELLSTDVIHSFWPPTLSQKRDLIPGKDNSLWLQADTPGVYRGQCAEYCGQQHAKMALPGHCPTPGQLCQLACRTAGYRSHPNHCARPPGPGSISRLELRHVSRHCGHAGRKPGGP